MISKLCIRRSATGTLLGSLPFSVIALLLTSCQAPQVRDTRFDGKWQICQPATSPVPLACLNEPDTQKLRKLLIQCGAEQ